jgi:hypothetical protein
MAPRARETKIAVKDAAVNNGTRRKRSTMASAEPSGPRRSKQTSQAEAAVAQKALRKFEGNFVEHENCVAYLAEGRGRRHFWLFKDGSAIESVDFMESTVPRRDALQWLPELLMFYYENWVEFGDKEEFTLQIAGADGFLGSAKEAFEAILRRLDPPADPSKKALNLIERSTAYMQSLQKEDQTAWQDVEKLQKTVERLVASGLIEARSLRRMIDLAWSVVRVAKARARGEDMGQSGGKAA